MPTPSWPGMNGGDGLTGHSPRAAWMSVWQRPLVSMRTSTWLASGVGMGSSSISSGRSKLWTTAAFMAGPLIRGSVLMECVEDVDAGAVSCRDDGGEHADDDGEHEEAGELHDGDAEAEPEVGESCGHQVAEQQPDRDAEHPADH